MWAMNAGTDVLPGAAVFSQAPYNEGPEMADKFVGWLRGESTEPGIDFVGAVEYGCPSASPTATGKRLGMVVRRRPARTGGRQGWADVRGDGVAVLPDHRRKGIGRALMDELLDWWPRKKLPAT